VADDSVVDVPVVDSPVAAAEDEVVVVPVVADDSVVDVPVVDVAASSPVVDDVVSLVVEEAVVVDVEEPSPLAGPVSGTQSLYTCHTMELSTPWNASQ
jgi:hypothetical protein